ncbi:MAG TPA: DUF6762 family protein [Clostridiaceae bacterium]
MDFSSLVLMERDSITNSFLNELGSYEVVDGAEYITKMYYDGSLVNVFFDTNRDVEEWEFSAIFDLFDETPILQEGFSLETNEDEYNPTFIVKFSYLEKHEEMENRLQRLCTLIKEQMEKVFEDINDKEEEYK